MISLLFWVFGLYIAGCLIIALTMALVALITMPFQNAGVNGSDIVELEKITKIANRSVVFAGASAFLVFAIGINDYSITWESVIRTYIAVSLFTILILLVLNSKNKLLSGTLVAGLFLSVRYILIQFGYWPYGFYGIFGYGISF